MGNTITRPITYGPQVMKSPRLEQAIRFLENEGNKDKPIPPALLIDYELDWLKEHGRLGCAERLREELQGGVIG